MSWIVAAIPQAGGELSDEALEEFGAVARENPAAPWKLETGHLRAGRELLEDLTGHSWAEVALDPEQVRSEYEHMAKDERATKPIGMASALLAFMGICARHGYGLEGGEGARRMRR